MRRRRPFPGVDLAPEARDLEHPFLAGDGVKHRTLSKRKHHITRRHERQLGEGASHGRKDLSQLPNRLADPLDRDAGIDQSLRGLEGHQVVETRVHLVVLLESISRI